ncbi:MAG: pilus assembly PilX N-terminal domain-containing protein [Deltaproteobacteria bacterium]|jgi:hypothetical protein|nr:pilus assembly PilX N-terminal domain-containing protein [Deltaproteobacteria bacterium]
MIDLKKSREGMILTFTMVFLVLIILMGIYVLTSSRTDLTISSHNRVGRQAFNVADSAVQVATLLSRILVHPELGKPSDVLKVTTGQQMPITVEINDDRFNLFQLQEDSANFDYESRYLEVIDYPSHGTEPHLVFKVADKVVATASVALDKQEPVSEGFSLDASDPYDESAGTGAKISLTVTVNGTPPGATADSLEEPRSIITAIYRELM